MAAKLTLASLAQELETVRHENAELRKLLDTHDGLIVRHEKFIDWFKANRMNQSASHAQTAQPAEQAAQPPQRRNFLNRFGKKHDAAPANGAPIVTTWQDYAKYLDAVKEAAIRSKRSFNAKNYAEAKYIPLKDLLATITP